MEVERIVEKEVIREVQVEVPVEKEVIKEVTRTKVVEVIATREPEPTTMRAANIGPVEFLDSAKSQSVNDTFNALMLAGVVTSDVTVTQTLPEIAQAWDIDDSGTNFTFRIRDDVVYHNGNRLVADDIVWNWTRVREEIAERGRGKAHIAIVTDFSAQTTYILREHGVHHSCLHHGTNHLSSVHVRPGRHQHHRLRACIRRGIPVP